jgi:hypothetical protein
MGDMEDPLGHLPVLREKWERAVEDGNNADLDACITQWMGIVQVRFLTLYTRRERSDNRF